MIRSSIISLVQRSRPTTRPFARASFVTAAQKRALNEKQLTGHDATAASANPTEATVTITELPSSSGSQNMVLPITALLAVASGTAYYMGLIPGLAKSSPLESIHKDAATLTTPSLASPVAATKKEEEVETKSDDPTINPLVTSEQTDKKKKKKKGTEVTTEEPLNRVIHIQSFAPSDGEKYRRHQEQSQLDQTTPQHDPDGHRVSVLLPSLSHTMASVNTTNETALSQPTLADSAKMELGLHPQNTITVDETLKRAHALLKGSLDESFLVDLETLSPAQLRIRVVQLVSDMAERTKWEAVRLKEFLALKEREVTDRYLEILQKQRLEFEDLLAKRIREREHEIVKAANEAIQAKDQAVEGLLDAAIKTQKQEHDAEMENLKNHLQLELSTKYEVSMESKLAAQKEQFVKELSEKVREIEHLKERMDNLQRNLESSRDFEYTSQKAHRVSAAALALMEKMESGHSAVEQYAILKEAASENEVIGSVLSQIPSTIKTGIPTLPELQASFENVHKAGRQAALIPSGILSLGGQVAGLLLSKITAPPSPDSIVPSPENVGAMSDYILSCANYYVKVGDLENAVYELEKLTGQTAFTVEDWKKSAMDRIAVEKVLKVIKLECSLLNKSMGGSV